MLSTEAKEARNAYMREYRRKNKERIQAQREVYWERKAAEQPREEQTEHEKEKV